MICEHCKERHANVTVTQVQNGETVQHHYCDVCAQQMNPFQLELQDEPISLQQFITNWFGSLPKQQTHEQAVNQAQKACPTCQLTYQQFLKKGKFGCANCYTVFRPMLPSIFDKLQAGTKHKSTTTVAPSPVRQLQLQIGELRQKMKRAIAEERFEDAAMMRDEVKKIEQKMLQGGNDTP
jgi:protein arginine kinase activator